MNKKFADMTFAEAQDEYNRQMDTIAFYATNHKTMDNQALGYISDRLVFAKFFHNLVEEKRALLTVSAQELSVL